MWTNKNTLVQWLLRGKLLFLRSWQDAFITLTLPIRDLRRILEYNSSHYQYITRLGYFMALNTTSKYSLAFSFCQRFLNTDLVFLIKTKKSTTKPHILLYSAMNCPSTTFNWEVKHYGCDYTRNVTHWWFRVLSTNKLLLQNSLIASVDRTTLCSAQFQKLASCTHCQHGITFLM